MNYANKLLTFIGCLKRSKCLPSTLTQSTSLRNIRTSRPTMLPIFVDITERFLNEKSKVLPALLALWHTLDLSQLSRRRNPSGSDQVNAVISQWTYLQKTLFTYYLNYRNHSLPVIHRASRDLCTTLYINAFNVRNLNRRYTLNQRCLKADSHYTSRFHSVAKRHRSVKFSHV